MPTSSDNFLEFVGSYKKFGQSADAIKGESQDTIHPNTCELKTFEFGVENANTVGSGTGGAGAGRAKFNPFKVTRNVDIGSGMLFEACGAGCHFPQVNLYVRKSGGGVSSQTKSEYLIFRFAMVFVTNISWSGGEGEDAPTENVEFAYGGMTIEYRKQKQDGTLDATATGKASAGWNQLQNKEMQVGETLNS